MTAAHGRIVGVHLVLSRVDGGLTATPLTETITETQPVTGQSTGRIRADLEAVLLMDAHLPWLAEYVDQGWDELYLHFVGQDQSAFIDAFGEHVLPQLSVTAPQLVTA